MSNLSLFNSSHPTISSAYTFSDKLKMEDLPSFLAPIFEQHSAPTDRDKMILGTLNIVSGLIGGASDTGDTRTGLYGMVLLPLCAVSSMPTLSVVLVSAKTYFFVI